MMILMKTWPVMGRYEIDKGAMDDKDITERKLDGLCRIFHVLVASEIRMLLSFRRRRVPPGIWVLGTCFKRK